MRACIVADCRPNQCQKRSTIRAKETYYVRNFESLLARWSQMPVPLDSSVKRDLLQCQKRPTTVLKETCALEPDAGALGLKCHKRPTTVSKETYYSVKRDLLQCQKRPTTVSKETCALEPDAGALGLHPHRVHVTRCNHEPVRALATHSHHIRNTLATH